MKTRIQNSSSISNTTYHSRCRSDGQRNWWLMRDDGNFVDIGEHRGDRTLAFADR